MMSVSIYLMTPATTVPPASPRITSTSSRVFSQNCQLMRNFWLRLVPELSALLHQYTQHTHSTISFTDFSFKFHKKANWRLIRMVTILLMAKYLPTGWLPTGWLPTGWLPTGWLPTGWLPLVLQRLPDHHPLSLSLSEERAAGPPTRHRCCVLWWDSGSVNVLTGIFRCFVHLIH